MPDPASLPFVEPISPMITDFIMREIDTTNPPCYARAMNLTLHIPDDLAARLAADGGNLERRALEALVLEELRAGRVSKTELQRALGFAMLDEADDFLKAHGMFEEHALGGLERETRDRLAASGKALAAEFRAFRRGRSLGGLDPMALVREGLR